MSRTIDLVVLSGHFDLSRCETSESEGVPGETQSREMSLGPQPRQRRHTEFALERVWNNGHYTPPTHADLRSAPYGRYDEWHVIGQGTRIKGGVLLGRVAREALVMNVMRSNAAGRVRAACRKRVLEFGHAYQSGRRTFDVHEFELLRLRCIMDFVLEVMPYSEAGVAEIRHKLKLKPDECVMISEYINARVGVCRHQASLFGLLVEFLQDDGLMGGRGVTIRRRFMGIFSHAWVEYTSPRGTKFIIDVAQNRLKSYADLDDVERFVYDCGN